MPVWAGALAGVAALLVAAKAHGRQVRLEREAAGYHSVEFGGDNPAFVEDLWRRDRLRFWPLVGAVAAISALLTWMRWRDAPLTLVASLLWSPIVGFHYAGLRSFVGQNGRGGIGWWCAAVACFVASITLTLL